MIEVLVLVGGHYLCRQAQVLPFLSPAAYPASGVLCTCIPHHVGANTNVKGLQYPGVSEQHDNHSNKEAWHLE